VQSRPSSGKSRLESTSEGAKPLNETLIDLQLSDQERRSLKTDEGYYYYYYYIFKPTIGQESLHQDSNDNGVRLVNFAISKNLVVKSMMFPQRNIHKQYCAGDKIKKNEMGWACGAYG